MINYLEDKPILTKLFDYTKNDAELYRPRELGNVFNMIDAYLILFSMRSGIYHFLSPLYFIIITCISTAPLLFLWRQKLLKNIYMILAMLLGLLYLSSSSVFFSTYYFRTSKIVVSFLTVCLFLFLSGKTIHRKRSQNMVSFLFVMITICLMGMIDETGIIVALFFTAYFLIVAMVNIKRKEYWSNVIAAVVGLGCIGLYRKVVSPFISFSIMGKPPTEWGMGFSSFDIQQLFLSGQTVLHAYVSSLHRVVPPMLLLPFIVCVVFVLSYAFVETHIHIKKRTSRFLYTLLFFVLFMYLFYGGTSLILGVMGMSFPALYFENTLLIYYPLPFATLWFIVLICALFYVVKKFRYSEYFFVILLPLCLVVNIWTLQNIHTVLKNNWKIQQFYTAGFPLLNAIQKDTIHSSEYTSIDGYDVIPLLRKKLGKSVIYDVK